MFLGPAATVPQPSRSTADVICLSHLAWDAIDDRSRDVIARTAINGRVYFVEVPVFRSGITAQLHIHRSPSLTRVRPHLPSTLAPDDIAAAQRRLVSQLIRTERIHRYLLWYSAPTPLAFTNHLRPLAVIYDCSAARPAGERTSRTHEPLDPVLMRQAALLVVNGQPLRQRGRNRSADILLCAWAHREAVDGAEWGG
jgi:UDP-galactopyranose mutase